MKMRDLVHDINRRDKGHHMIMLICLIVFMTAVTGICSQIHAGELLVFVCFQLLCIILPGAAVMALMPVKNRKGVESLVFIYASGYMVTMILYVALMVTVGNAYVRAGFFPLPILACAILMFKRKRETQPPGTVAGEPGNIIWIGAVLAVFFVSLIAFCMRWKIPYAAGANNYETDFLYWAGDIVALKKQFPPKEFRTLAPNYRYHYFGALQQAAVSTVTGIQAVKVAVCYSYIEGAVLLGLSSYALVDRLIKNKAAQAITLLLMLFSTGYEDAVPMTYIWHMYQVPMSYHIAQSFGILVVVLLLIQLENKRVDMHNLVWSLCCLLCCTGTKSAAGVVVLCGVVITYLYRFLSQSNRRMAGIVMGAFLLVFGAAGVFLWPIARSFNLALHLPEIHFDSGNQAMRSLFSCIAWIGKYFVTMAASNFWILVPAGFYSIFLVIQKKIEKRHILLLILMLVGTMGNYIIEFNGNSQMYFGFIAFPFAAALTGCLIEEVFQGYLSPRRQYFAAALLGAAAIVFMLRNNYGGYFVDVCRAGLKNIDIPNPAGKDTGQCLIEVSQAQCEAYSWIRENTEEDVVLLSDRVWGNLHDPTSIFSERYVYLYHDYEMDYLRGISCFAGNQTAVRYYAELGLDYIVVRKFFTPLFQCPEDVGEVAFENDEVAVYKLFWGQKGKTGVFY